MKIALLSDVHANLPALRAALSIADRLGADRVVVAGDLVGDGPHPVEVVTEAMARGAECVRGNVDRQVLEMASGDGKLRKQLRSGKGQKRNRAWTALRLREASSELEWLSALPTERTVGANGRELLVVHGSPLGDTDYVYPSITGPGLIAKLAPLDGYRPAALVCGHSHVPFARTVEGVLVINCGSVGRPADGDPRGSMALLDVAGTDEIQARMIRFTYPVAALLQALQARQVPGIEPEDYRLGLKR